MLPYSVHSCDSGPVHLCDFVLCGIFSATVGTVCPHWAGVRWTQGQQPTQTESGATKAMDSARP